MKSFRAGAAVVLDFALMFIYVSLTSYLNSAVENNKCDITCCTQLVRSTRIRTAAVRRRSSNNIAVRVTENANLLFSIRSADPPRAALRCRATERNVVQGEYGLK